MCDDVFDENLGEPRWTEKKEKQTILECLEKKINDFFMLLTGKAVSAFKEEVFLSPSLTIPWTILQKSAFSGADEERTPALVCFTTDEMEWSDRRLASRVKTQYELGVVGV